MAMCGLRAQAWTGTQSDAWTNRCPGFHGVANIQQSLVLTATSNAPAGASGKAVFIAADDNGTNYTLLFVKTRGLTNGAYTVQVADDTRTNFYDLGTLNVATRTNFNHEYGDDSDQDSGEESDSMRRLDGRHGHGWDQFHDGSPGAGWTNWIWQCASTNRTWTNLFRLGDCTNLYWFATNAYCWYTNTLTVGSGSFTLPNGLTQSNATLITVSDSESSVDLSGDFSGVTNSTVSFKEVADIIAGAAVNAQGSATIVYRLVMSKTLASFRLDASGLPPREKLFLTANGAQTVKVYTKRNGTLHLSGFRRVKAATLVNIVATDTSGNIVFTVNF
jgi:hypothetical protein